MGRATYDPSPRQILVDRVDRSTIKPNGNSNGQCQGPVRHPGDEQGGIAVDGQVHIWPSVIIHGHALTVLRSLEAESVHCCICSPPYWGLRSYSTEPQVWGGDSGCSHEFAASGKLRPGRDWDPFKGDKSIGRDYTAAAGLLCAKCGAWQGEFGLEPTPDLYVEHLVEIFREVRRVLRSDGTLWLNLGDSYATGAGQVGECPGGGEQGARWCGRDDSKGRGTPKRADGTGRHSYVGPITQPNRMPLAGLKPLDLVGIPWRAAFALQADGWYLRSGIIWHKQNPMPESVSGWRWERCRVKTAESRRATLQSAHSKAQAGINKPHAERDGIYFADQSDRWKDCPGCKKCETNDGYVLRKGSWRPTTAHEYIFLLTKTGDYFADAEAVKEPCESGASDVWKMLEGKDRIGGRHKDLEDPLVKANAETNIGRRRADGSPAGRNKRSVWTVNTQPFPGAHFAVFPLNLVRPMVQASTPEGGVCGKCSAPFARVMGARIPAEGRGSGNLARKLADGNGRDRLNTHLGSSVPRAPSSTLTEGWKPTCACGADSVPATVIDCFAGAGTTGCVAKELNRRFIGIELNEDYVRMAEERIAAHAPVKPKKKRERRITPAQGALTL